MIPKNRQTTHPGKILKEYYFVPNNFHLAKALGWTISDLFSFYDGKKSLSEKNAEDLSKYLGTTKELWINLQKSFDRSSNG